MWRWRILPLVGEVVLLLLTAGGLGYTAQTLRWPEFWTILVVAAALLSVLKWIEHGPILRLLADAEKKQSRLSTDLASWGIQDIFNMRHQEEMARRNAATKNLIEDGRNFSLSAETAASYIDPAVRRHWDLLKPKLDAGCPFRLLILDPFCDSKSLRNKQNGITSPIDPKLRLDLLSNLAKSYQNIEIRFTKEPYCSVFITDKGLIYDPYHAGKDVGRIENYFIALAITKSGDEKAYWLLQSHFTALWNEAQSFESWRREHRGKY